MTWLFFTQKRRRFIQRFIYYSRAGVLEFCEDMQAVEGNPLESLARWYRYVYGDAECFDPSYATAIERYSNPEFDQVGTDNGSKYFKFAMFENL